MLEKNMGMKKARITIVVTCYNKEKYIKRCLQSILDQTDPDFKLLVIDDQSTDNSLKICKQYCKNTDYKVLSYAHSGQSSARNRGIALADTEYIFFVDGDDYIAPDTIEVLNKSIDGSPELVLFGVNHAVEDGRILTRTYLPQNTYCDQEEIRKNIVSMWNSDLMCFIWNKLFSLDVIRKNKISFEDKDFGEDLTFVCDYMKHCNRITVLDRCLYIYREHRLDSQSKKIRENLFEIRRDEYFELQRYFKDIDLLNRDSMEYVTRRYVERVMGCIENEASLWNRKPIKKKLKKIRSIVEDDTVQESLKHTRLRSKKMRILTWFVKMKKPRSLYGIGVLLSIVKNCFPKWFLILKMHR